jgi:hypothetical protein
VSGLGFSFGVRGFVSVFTVRLKVGLKIGFTVWFGLRSRTFVRLGLGFG